MKSKKIKGISMFLRVPSFSIILGYVLYLWGKYYIKSTIMNESNPRFLENFSSQINQLIQEEVDKAISQKINQIVSKEYYSIKEVQAITGLSIHALKGRRKRGTLKFINDGNAILMHKDELNRLLNKWDKS